MKIDNTKTEKENILNHINQALHSSSPIEESQISFGNPVALSGVLPSTVNKNAPNNEYISNTEIEVIPSKDFPWATSRKIRYRRVDLRTQWDILFPKLNPSNYILYKLSKGKEPTYENIKKVILYSYPLKEESITIDLEDRADGRKIVTIRPIANSLLYVGKLVLLNVEFRKYKEPPKPVVKPSIDTAITDGDSGTANSANGYTDPKVMDGLIYATP